jgi:hypothetical protein
MIARSKREGWTRAAPAALACLAVLFFCPRAHAGHEIAYYPSFYPQEITLHTVDPAAAAERLGNNDLHAYLGATPRFKGAVPQHLASVESLDGFLVLDFNPASKYFADREQRCAAGRAIIRNLSGEVDGVVLVPYPVTPFHPDYLQHLDRFEEAKAALSSARGPPSDIKVNTKGDRARALLGGRFTAGDEHWDVRLESVRLSAFAGASLPVSGQASPPWRKQGWYQAYRLLSPGLEDAALRKDADSIYQRLTKSEHENLKQRFNLERRLISVLTSECRRMVAGYTLRREYYSADYSNGIENVGYDGQSGMNSPVFVRTAKLKDLPWNGWLYLGIQSNAKAAWNPVAGFNDPPGRLIWSAIGDAALIPIPYNAGFIPNRVSAEAEYPDGASASNFKLPPAALAFNSGSGEFRLVGTGRTSSARVTYYVNASLHQDGTKTDVSDLLYAYVFAYRWAKQSNPDDSTFDPDVESATRLMRERLVGLRIVRVDSKTSQLASDIKYTRETPVIEVYLDHGKGEPLEVAAIAPPWSAIPWHLVVLMEEAVKRNLAAFSQAQAMRKNVPWLDLARDPDLQPQLLKLIAGFETEGYRPDELVVRVTREQARARWAALKAFAEKHGHLLVTNGPFRLKEWSEDKVVLDVVREITYPWGVGAFDGYTYPARAVINDARREGDTVTLGVDLEKVVKAERRYSTVREPFRKAATRGMFLIRADAPYLMVDAEGEVVYTGKAIHAADGRFEIKLPDGLPSARYTLLAAIFPDGNRLRPAITRLSLDAGG